MVVWTEWGSGNIYYRIYRNGQWSNMKNAGIVRQQAWSNQLAVDSYGRFHVTYADGYSSGSRDIYYSYFTGSSWTKPERVYYSPHNSAWNRVDIDTNNRIHVAWYHSHTPKGETGSNVVTISKPRMGNWPTNFENVSRSSSIVSIHPALCVKGGNIYVCWMEAASRMLYFCEKSAGKWKSPKQIYKRGYYPDIEIDNSGNIHVVFSNRSGNLYYMSRIKGNWTNTQVLSNGDAPLQFADLNKNNNMLVATWVQRSGGKVKVYGATKIPGNNWTPALQVGDAGEEGKGKHAQVAIDNRGCAHFVWRKIAVGGKFDTFYEKVCFGDSKATFIDVDKSFLSFYTDGSKNPDPQTFRVRASGDKTLDYTISKNKSWLFVSPQQGSSSGEWDTVTVEVDSSNLNDGTYNGTITITEPNAYNNPVEVGISLTVGDLPDPPSESNVIEVDKVNMEFSMNEGMNPDAQTFNLRATGGESLGYTVTTNMDWLAAFPTSGTANSNWTPISVSIHAENRAPGTHNGRIDIYVRGSNKKVSVFVTLNIESKQIPSIQMNRKHFYFWGYANGDNPPSMTFKIRNSGSETLNYSIKPNKDWITVTPEHGSSRGEWDTVDVRVKISSLKVNTHWGNIQVSAPSAENSPQNISVEFKVERPPLPYPPIDIVTKRLNHVGLVIQEYLSEIVWKANPRNQGLFDVVKYRIYKRNKWQSNSPYIYVGEVPANVFIYYDSDYTSKEERNKYNYTVTAVDTAGRESMKGEAQGKIEISPIVSPEKKGLKKKNHLPIYTSSNKKYS